MEDLLIFISSDELRVTRKSIPDLHAEEAETINLGKVNEKFSFSHLENNVAFVDCSVKEDQISEIVAFINKYFV
jgi:hypothetical protein